MSGVHLNNITKQFNKTKALNNVSLEVYNKEFFVLFGPAGAGKTTFLNIIAGILVQEDGHVYFNDQPIDLLEPENRNVAMVFENYAVYPHFTVFENIASPLRSPKFKKEKEVVEKKVNSVAAKLGIDQLLDRKPSELSNGQRQRVALGRALVREPEVFLMDEPLSHLDAKLRHQMRAELKSLQTNLDATTVYVTHDYLEALGLGDRIAVINEGKIEQIGSPEEIYHYPRTEFVASSFGEPEINILQADIIDKNDSVYAKLFEDSAPFEIPEKMKPLIDHHANIRIGIRPKNIKFEFEQSMVNIPGTVYSFEPTGASAVLTVKIEDSLIRLVTFSDLDIKLNQKIYINPDLQEAIFFNEDNANILYMNDHGRSEHD